MLSLLAVVVVAAVACEGQVIGHGVPSCDSIYKYVRKQGQIVGAIVMDDPGGDVDLNVTVAFKWSWGHQISFAGIQLEQEIANRTRLLRYYVEFPVKRPRPTITNIKFNNKTVCKTQGSPYKGNYILNLGHTMKDRQRMVESSLSRMAPSASSVLESLVSNVEPGLVESSTPDLYDEPRLGPTPRTETMPLTTRRNTQPTTHSYPLLPSTTKAPPTTRVPPSKVPLVTQGQKKEICGISVRPQTLMLGGRDVEKGDWPWVATLHDVKTSVFKCAGVLVSNRFVVIAAHCVIDPIKHTKVNEEELVVIMGKFDFSKWVEREMQPREVQRIILPPGFSAAPLSNDIAILYLQDDVNYTMYARPVCLVDEPEPIDSLIDQVATVVGWNPGEDLPRRALVPIVSRKECRMLTGQDNNTFCAGNTTVSKHCVGDADSGLFIPKVGVDRNLRWYLRGLPSSHLHKNLGTCAMGGYVVYTDAAQFTPWIREVVRTTKPYDD